MNRCIGVGIVVLLYCCSAATSFSQTGAAIDKYLGAPAKLTTIGTASDNLSVPQDLDFSPVTSRKNELWVINYGDYGTGGYMVVFYDAGKPTQWSEKRHDSHSAHFMLLPTALAMGSPDSGYFSCIGEALNSVNDNVSTFMGPVLWDSDTSKFARVNQNDWVAGLPLGSHIDMLHQSPYSMGIAFDTLNQYWVFDGYHGCLFHYNFEASHGYGGDDHSDGEILKYKEVKLKRIPNLPSHMVVDASTGWLYIVDNGNKRIVRVDTRSGHLGSDLTAPNEILQQYSEMIGVKWQTVDSGFANLSGIDYFDGRLVVGNYGTGDIRVYNTTTLAKPTYLGTIQTSDAGMMGLKIGPDSNIWYVNRTRNQVIRLAPGAAAPVAATLLSPVNGASQVPIPDTLKWVKTNGATTFHLQVSLRADFAATVFDSSGITGTSTIIANSNTSTTYYWRVSAKNAIGEGPWSASWHFKTFGAKPQPVALVSPADAATNISLTPTLVWDSVGTVTSFDLQVALASDFTAPLVDLKNITLLQNSLTNLSVKTTYYWRVRSFNDGAPGDWSPIWSFTTLDPASVRETDALASKITVDEIYPNPSSTSSTVNFTLGEPLHLRVSVLDLLGAEVVVVSDAAYESGKHSLTTNTSTLPSGTYLYRFTCSSGTLVKSFVVRK